MPDEPGEGIQFNRTGNLLVSSDLGVVGEIESLVPGATKEFKTVLPRHLLSRSDTDRLPEELPLPEDKPALKVVRGSFGASLKSRLERAGLNMNGMKVKINSSGLIEVTGEVANNGAAPVKFDPRRMYRLYTVHDSPLSALGRTAATVFDPSQSVPKWAQEFIDSNDELLRFLKGYNAQTSKQPFSWRFEVSKNGALAFIVPLQRHYVMNPDREVDLTSTDKTAREAITPYTIPIETSHDLEVVTASRDNPIQLISDTPIMKFPKGWFGLVTTANINTNPYKDGFNVGGWTVPYDNASRYYIGERPIPPHGGSNLIDEDFNDEIATESLTTPQVGLPTHAAVLAMRM